METGFEALGREELRRVIEGRGNAGRVPVMLHFWINPGAFPEPERARAILDRYPQDAQPIWFQIPRIYEAPADDPS